VHKGSSLLVMPVYTNKSNHYHSQFMKILMVCLGNICRSPLAEGIMTKLVADHGLSWEVQSAGTASYHVGSAPDERSVAVAANHGIDITKQRSQQLQVADFYTYDLILAMDAQNYNNIKELQPEDGTAEIKMILNYAHPGQNRQVPDPYYHGGFDAVYDMLCVACEQVIEKET